MIRAKNYETASKFFKVMPRNRPTVAFFPRHGVEILARTIRLWQHLDSSLRIQLHEILLL